MTSPQFVGVLWNDAWGEETREATFSPSYEHKPVPMETRGWLIKFDDYGISLFPERCLETKDHVYRGPTFIPKGMIVKVYLIPEPRRPKVIYPEPVKKEPNADQGQS